MFWHLLARQAINTYVLQMQFWVTVSQQSINILALSIISFAASVTHCNLMHWMTVKRFFRPPSNAVSEVPMK